MLSMQTDEFLDAIQKGDLSKIDQLLATNPALASSKAKNGVSAILLALYYGHQDIAQAIAAKKGGLDIFEASVLGKLELVNFLLENGADPTAKTKDEKTPLTFAKEKNHSEVVETLKRHAVR